jgi:hypothetical protein
VTSEYFCVQARGPCSRIPTEHEMVKVCSNRSNNNTSAIRAESLDVALLEMAKVDDRRLLSAKV